MKSSHIVYQQLKEKYIPSALECLSRARIQKGAVFSDLGCDVAMVRKFSEDPFTGNLENQRRTLIAVDTTKDNFVAGINPGVDLCDYAQRLRKPSKIEELNTVKFLEFKLLESFIRQKYNYGQVIYASGLGVRSEYNGLGIAQNLMNLQLKNSKELGYKSMMATAYNPVALHILTKLGWKIYSHTRASEFQEIPQKYKKKLIKDNFYLLTQNIFEQEQSELTKEVYQEYKQNYQSAF